MTVSPAGKERQVALAIWEAGVSAVLPKTLMARVVQRDGLRLRIGTVAWDPRNAGRLIVVGGGKAAVGMAQELETILGEEWLSSGRVSGVLNVLAEQAAERRWIKWHPARPAGNPLPTEAGVAGCRQMLDLIRAANERDLVLCLLSGGASALMPCPVEGVSVADKRAVTDALSRRGADIRQLNAVRKHLSRIKGGRLAMAGSPQALVSLILSDVVGNPLDVIASGPTAPDPTTFADALDVLTSLGVMHTAPMAVCRHLEMGAGGAFEETPKALPANVHNLIVGDNDMALAAAAQAAEKRGYRVVNLGSRIEGESRDVGRQLAQKALAIRDRRDPVAPPACLLSGGETIVSHVKTGGKGGRNQELALAFLEELRTDGLRGVTLLSAGTDGEDGPTDAAGAWADAETLARARQKSLEPHEFLKSNRSYLFFEAVHSLLRTGPTHTNVMDLRVILIR